MSVLTESGGAGRPPSGPGGDGRPGRHGDGNGGPAPNPAPASARPAAAPTSGAGRVDPQADAIATIALGALTLGAVYSLQRLFSTGSYLGAVVATAVVMHAVAWGCRRRALRPAAAVTASLSALVLVVTWLVMPETTRYGVPLTGTLHGVRQALSQAGTEFHSVVAPAPVGQGFLLITVTAVGVIALLADWAAFRMRATLEAVVPSFTLFVFAAALGSRRHSGATVAVELAVLLAFVVVHETVVNQESAAWFASRTRGALGSAAQAGAAIGGAALLIGLVVGPLLPGASSKALILWRSADRGAGGGTRTIPSPLVDLRTRLVDNPDVEVFTVKSTAPEYWRLTSLDSFNGIEWSSDNSYNTVGHLLGSASTATAAQRVQQQYSITGPISSIWLPAAYEPVRIDGVSGVSYNADSGSLISSRDTTEGLNYQVSSVISLGQLNPQTLEKAGPVATGGSLQRYLKLPALPQSIVDEARRVTAGKSTEYDKAKALQDYFRSPPFVYDDQFTLGDGNNALEQFLFTYHRGYCQQFAGAYAVMARVLGLPTRVAVGFSYGEQDSAGVWHVRDTYAHAWPEVFFPGSGWVPFEPTPGRGIPGAQQYTGVPAAEQGSTPQTPSATPGTAPGSASATTPTTPARIPKGELGQSSSATVKIRHQSPEHAVAVWLIIILVLAGMWVVVVGGTWWFLRTSRRASVQSWPDRDAGPPGDRPPDGMWPVPRWFRALRLGSPVPVEAAAPVLVAWIEASELLAWWGMTRRSDETFLEFAQRSVDVLRLPLGLEPGSGSALLRLAGDSTAAEYAPGSLAEETPARAIEAVTTVERALVAAASRTQRLRRVLDPRLVFGPAARRRARAARAISEPRLLIDASAP